MGLLDLFNGQKKRVPGSLENPIGAVAVTISRTIGELGLDKFLEMDLYFGFTLDGEIEVGNDNTIKFGKQAAIIFAWTSKSGQFRDLKTQYRLALDMGKIRREDIMAPMRMLVLDHMTMYEDTIAKELVGMMDWPRFHAERKRRGG